MRNFRLGVSASCTSMINLNLMGRLVGGVLALLLSVSIHSEEQSAYGFDYLKITKNPLLAEIMLELEPKLVALYKSENMDESDIRWGLKGIAKSFRDDEMFKPMLKDLEAASRPALLKLAGLPEDKYPTLHGVVKLVRLNIRYKQKYGIEWTEAEYESSMKLYRALHGGKEFNDK